MTKTRIQTRGICSICNKLHAVSNGKIVATHGYTVQWNSFSNACSGSHSPHYGHVEAPAFILEVVASLETYLGELPRRIKEAKTETLSLTKRADVHSNRRYISQLESQLDRDIPEAIVSLTERAENWKPMDLIDVDLIVEEREAKEARQAEKAIKDDAKRQAVEAKAERQDKAAKNAAAKETLLLSEQWRQIHLGGELVLEEKKSFKCERDITEYFREALFPFLVKLVEQGTLSVEDLYYGNYKLNLVSRTEQGKKGRQLDKFPYSLNYQFDERIKDLIK
jgi:hypothetical protein